jgi:phospholipid transport system substrate-binding protein
MCRIAVGPDWTAMSGEDKGAVLQAFDRYIVTTYAARFRSYSNQKFEIGAVKPAGADRLLVETKLVRSNGEPVELNYLFRLNDDSWRVIDIYLAGSISQMAQLRSEFAQSLRQGGAAALVATLEQKIEDLKKDA